MADYVLTGGATGIGAAIREQLEEAGNQVFVIDIGESDCQVDLSSKEGRDKAIQAVYDKFPEGIDGFIPCAGLGPATKSSSLVLKVNFFAARMMLESLKPLLEKKQGAAIIISSNSAPMGADDTMVELMLENDEPAACERADALANGQNAYGGSKLALTRWMRRVSADYAGQGVRLNAVAPGIIQTPLTDKVLADESLGPLIKAFGESVPLGQLGQPAYIADVVSFLLSPAARFICGAVLFVDGGHDAMLRPDDF